ncbi:MAG: hypothetical protein U1A22_07725 [Xanthomonadaceae bacterium]|nr:hypothetical protein [Xanthomonadaceae bacterium]
MPLTLHSSRILLAFSGCGLVAVGLIASPAMATWHSGRALELAILALLALGLAALLRKVAQLSWASAVLAVVVAAHLLLAGPWALAAAALVSAAAMALGSWIVPESSRARPALALLSGLAVLGTAVGWTLSLPIHHRWAYGIVLIALVVIRRAALVELARAARDGWREAIAASPRMATAAVVVLGLASTGTWLPTLQFDDLAYHLGLPFQLAELGYYRLDPSTQVWALAPWLGDVIQAIAQVLAGVEARGSVNLIWLLAGASAIWSLSRSLLASAGHAWMSVALFASLPLTATLAGGMQAEGPGASYALALALIVAGHVPQEGPWRLRAAAIFAGALLALKVSFALIVLPIGIWLLMKVRARLPLAALPVSLLLGLLVAGSSYAHAWLLTGNPVLPLYNASFASDYFPIENFRHSIYQQGFDLALPWTLTFETGRYYEGLAGSAGFLLIGLLGGLLASLVDRSARPLALVGLFACFAPLWFMQYARYAHPGMVLLIVPMWLGVARLATARTATWLGIGLICLNLAFQSSAYWIFRTGAVKKVLTNVGRDAELLRDYAPERMLIRRLNSSDPDARVLFGGRPFIAELAGRGFTFHWYDHQLNRHRDALAKAESTEPLTNFIHEFGFTHVILSGEPLWPRLPEQIEALRAERVDSYGDATLWRLPPGPEPAIDPVVARDLARRLWQP